MRSKKIFIIIAVALMITVVGIGYLVNGNKKTSSNIEIIASKEENIVNDIGTSEITQNTITEIKEQENKETEIEEQKIEETEIKETEIKEKKNIKNNWNFVTYYLNNCTWSWSRGILVCG